MPDLNNIRAADVCEANEILLKRDGLSQVVNTDGYIDVSRINSIEQRDEFIGEFCDNEENNIKYLKKNYQKEKYKAKHIIMLMIIGLTLIGTGFFIASLLIVTPIILPIASILLLSGVAIIALTKLCLNMRLNSLETSKLQAEAFFDKVMASKGNNEDETNANRAVIQAIKEATLEVTKGLSEKLDALDKNTQRFFNSAEFASRPMNDDAANKLDNIERLSSPSHS